MLSGRCRLEFYKPFYILLFIIVMQFQVEIYVTASGKCPFTDWLNGLKDRQARARILTRLDRLEAGNFGDCKAVGGSVMELRIDYGPGYRLYCSRVGQTAVLLLCGGDKSAQQTDIQMAKSYLEDYKRRADDA